MCMHAYMQVSGFDKQLLNSLYDDAIQRRYLPPTVLSGATPMPVTNPFDDMFGGPPSPVRAPVSMAMMQQQQALATPRQHRLSRMSGSRSTGSGNPFEVPGSPQSSATASPPYLASHQQPGNYQNNPFGNPNLL